MSDVRSVGIAQHDFDGMMAFMCVFIYNLNHLGFIKVSGWFLIILNNFESFRILL